MNQQKTRQRTSKPSIFRQKQAIRKPIITVKILFRQITFGEKNQLKMFRELTEETSRLNPFLKNIRELKMELNETEKHGI